MRRTTTHHRTLTLVALTLLLAGCGTQAGSGTGDGGDTVSPSPTESSTPSPSTPSSPGCTTAGAELGAADSGRTVCLAAGGTVRISLDGTKARPWKPVSADGSGLEATNSGFVLRAGDASAAFKAVSAGTARLSSSRPLCAAETGRISCQGLQEWWVDVVVK